MTALFSAALLAACGVTAPRVENVAAASDDSAAAKRFSAEVPAEPVREGGVFLVTIQSQEEVKDVTALFQGHLIDFFPDGPHDDAGVFHRYSALVGVEYGTTPGNVELSVKVKLAADLVERKLSVSVKAGEFPSERLHVPPKTVFPSAKERRQIARDRVVLNRAYATKTLNRYWDPPLVMPISSDITSVFGSSRVYNGKKQNVHFGTDLRAPTGTPIAAPIAGQVAVARKLFYTGYTVILDHGYGLFTIYGHMSKLKVKEGEVVKKGQVMGLSGMTGRASGPHLHWGVNLHGTKVDPMVLVQALKNQG